MLSAFADEPYAVSLLSDGVGERGRWSYVARRPTEVLSIAADDERDPFVAMTRLIAPPRPIDPAGPPFQGGVIGLAGYELADRSERLGLGRMDGWPDLVCARYDTILAFDHRRHEVLAIGPDAEAALGWLGAASPSPLPGALADEILAPNAERHEAAVAAIVARIAAGEIFQANLARAWTGRLAPGRRPFDLFLRLAGASIAPFAAYLRLAGLALVSNSPEQFLQVTPSGEALIAETRVRASSCPGTSPAGALRGAGAGGGADDGGEPAASPDLLPAVAAGAGPWCDTAAPSYTLMRSTWSLR